MALEEDDDDAGGIPEWVVTFGDMMSLLLTFFIMLVSMSEIKDDEQYQAMIDSMRQQFGQDASILSLIPGDNAANSPMQSTATAGVSKRKNTEEGGSDATAIPGENQLVRTIRTGNNSTLGGVIYFDEDSAELSPVNQAILSKIVPQLVGKPQKIEVRGHASRKPPQVTDQIRDQWDLAYARCYHTMKFLIEQGIKPSRIRLGSAAANEPISNGLTPESRRRNARVEILMWDERVGDFETSAP